MRRLPTLAWHPLLLAVYPILFLFSENTDQISLTKLAAPLAIALGGVLLLWVGLYFLFRGQLAKIALFASLLAVIFLGHGHLHTALHLLFLETGTSFGGRQHAELMLKLWIHIVMLLGWVAILGIVTWRLRKTPRDTLVRISWAANVLAAVLLAFPLTTAIAAIATGSPEETRRRVLPQEVRDGLVRELGYRPDIYHIVLDGYGRQDVLAEYFDFDNGELITWLKDRGFVVPSQSYSNYAWTQLSLASFLNLRYLDEMAERVKKESRSQTRGRTYQMARDHEVMHFLRERGYRYLHLRSTWGATLMNGYADQEIACDRTVFDEELYRVLVESTLLKIWESPMGASLAECHLQNLATLGRIGAAPGPKMVFAH